eukprot:356031-Chlamydomonas_euryale.AAC.5
MMLTKSVAMSGRTVTRPAMSGRTAAIAQPTLRSRCVAMRSAEENKEGECQSCGRTRNTSKRLLATGINLTATWKKPRQARFSHDVANPSSSLEASTGARGRVLSRTFQDHLLNSAANRTSQLSTPPQRCPSFETGTDTRSLHAHVAAPPTPETPPSAEPPKPPAPPAAPKAPGFGEVMAFSGIGPETINGRLAMLGFVAAVGAELSTGEPVLQQWAQAPTMIFATFALIIVGSLVPFLQGDKNKTAVGPLTPSAELLNGRAAMIGFASLLILEAVNGRALL